MTSMFFRNSRSSAGDVICTAEYHDAAYIDQRDGSDGTPLFLDYQVFSGLMDDTVILLNVYRLHDVC